MRSMGAGLVLGELQVERLYLDKCCFNCMFSVQQCRPLPAGLSVEAHACASVGAALLLIIICALRPCCRWIGRSIYFLIFCPFLLFGSPTQNLFGSGPLKNDRYFRSKIDVVQM